MKRQDRETLTGLGARLRGETSASLTAMLADSHAAWPRVGEMTPGAAAALLDDPKPKQVTGVTAIYFIPSCVDVAVPSML